MAQVGHQSQPKDGYVRIIAIGNPGAGKSTVLNCLKKDAVFEAGLSVGSGLTSVVKWSNDDGRKWALGDTPGLDDIEKRAQAAAEITKGLREDGEYALFFFLKLESGRMRSQDMSTIKVVMESIRNAVDTEGLGDQVDGGRIPYHVIVNGLKPQDYASGKAAASLKKSIQHLESLHGVTIINGISVVTGHDGMQPLAGTVQVSNINPVCTKKELEDCFKLEDERERKCVVDHESGSSECKVRFASSALAHEAVARFNNIELHDSTLAVTLYSENLAALKQRRESKFSDAVPSKRGTKLKQNPVLTVLDHLKNAAGHEPDSLICLPLIDELDDEDNAVVPLPDKFEASISEAARLKINRHKVEEVKVEDYDTLQEEFVQQQKQYEKQEQQMRAEMEKRCQEVAQLKEELKHLKEQNGNEQLQMMMNGVSQLCELGFRGVQVGIDQYNHSRQVDLEESKWKHEAAVLKQNKLSAPSPSSTRSESASLSSVRPSSTGDARESAISWGEPTIRYTAPRATAPPQSDFTSPASSSLTGNSHRASAPAPRAPAPDLHPPGSTHFVKNRIHAINTGTAVDHTDLSNRRPIVAR